MVANQRPGIIGLSGFLLFVVLLFLPSPLPAETAPAKGRFLLAGQSMIDPRFQQAVILILEHGQTGTVGLIVNKPHPVSLEHAFKLPEGIPADQPLFYGGPVSPGLAWLLFSGSDAPPGTVELLPGVYVANADLLVDAVEYFSVVKKMRIFSGYSGWAAGQLEAEIKRGSWKVIPARPADIFDDDPDSLWDYLNGKGNGVLI